MKTLATLLTGAAALALSACGSADDKAADAPDVTVVEDGEPVPVVTETTVVRDSAEGDRVSVDANGVNVDVKDGNTRVKAGENGASVSVDN
jgi:ABC-type glycerol-3-phosphate transport system substrate-binding protein